jgi:hypothetical protein
MTVALADEHRFVIEERRWIVLALGTWTWFEPLENGVRAHIAEIRAASAKRDGVMQYLCAG